MKQQEVFKKIGTILKELNDQYQYLGDTETQLNDLELELFVANAHFLADHAGVLRKLNTQNIAAATPAAVAIELPVKKQEEKYFEPLVQHENVAEEEIKLEPEIEATHSIEEPPPHIDLGGYGADDDFSYIRQEPEIIKHELVLDESEVWEDEDDPGFEIEEVADIEEPTPKASPVKTHKTEPVKEVPVAEAKEEAAPAEPKKAAVHTEIKKEHTVKESKKEPETEEPLTINQMMSAQLNKSGSKPAEHSHVQPVTDLKQAITLNDKLLYIRDLFNGYNLAYSEAIDILNRFSTFAEAEDFLKTNYAAKNHWGSKEATVDKFYELLRRRYS